MEAMTIVFDDREWTLEERDALPDDGRRYELIDGKLVVSPAPVPNHQRAARGLFVALLQACPPELEPFFAPFDVFLDPKTAMQPDLLVVRRTDVGAKGADAAPVLAIEVLSPSTQMVDRNLKLERFERAAMPSYWLLDPAGPTLFVYELRAGRYDLVEQVTGDQPWSTTTPYPITIVASTLLD